MAAGRKQRPFVKKDNRIIQRKKRKNNRGKKIQISYIRLVVVVARLVASIRELGPEIYGVNHCYLIQDNALLMIAQNHENYISYY